MNKGLEALLRNTDPNIPSTVDADPATGEQLLRSESLRVVGHVSMRRLLEIVDPPANS